MAETTTAWLDPLDEKNFHQIKSSLQDTKGVSYHEFKKTLRPSYGRIWAEILGGWYCLILSFFLAAWLIDRTANTWLKLLIVLVVAKLTGFIVTFLINFFHEAAHYNIARDKSNNDFLANVFLGVLQAQGIKHYRIVHWQHHVNLGGPEDTEHSYFEPLSLRFFIESLTGIRALRIFIFRNKNVAATASAKNTPDVKREGRLMLLAGVIFHLAVLSFFILIGQYWLILTWLLGFGTFFPFFSSLRQLLEHRSELADKKLDYSKVPHGKLTRIFNSNFFAATFGSAGFNRHLLHHLEPQLSYTNLKQVEYFLRDTAIGPQLKKQKTSYLKVFIALLGK